MAQIQAQTTFPRDGYRMPTGQYIAQGEATAALYKAEDRAKVAIQTAANELGKVIGDSDTPVDKDPDFWRRYMPETMYTMLDSFESSVSVLAAIAYLTSKGYVVSPEIALDEDRRVCELDAD